MGARFNVSLITCARMSPILPKFTHMLITEFNTVKSEGAVIGHIVVEKPRKTHHFAVVLAPFFWPLQEIRNMQLYRRHLVESTGHRTAVLSHDSSHKLLCAHTKLQSSVRMATRQQHPTNVHGAGQAFEQRSSSPSYQCSISGRASRPSIQPAT